MIPSDAHAFRAGLRPAVAGAYFRLAELLAEHAEDPSDAVRSFVSNEVTRLRETGRGVVETVRQVEADARLCGFEPPAPPRFPSDYGDWWDAVYDPFAHAAGVRSDLHAAGHALGMALVALNVLCVVLRLRVEDPASPTLTQRSHVLLEELAFVAGRCAVAGTNEMSDDVRRVLRSVQTRLGEVGVNVEAVQESDRVADMIMAGQGAQAVLRELDAAVQELSSALHARSVGEA
jgi:hypothetical protein